MSSRSSPGTPTSHGGPSQDTASSAANAFRAPYDEAVAREMLRQPLVKLHTSLAEWTAKEAEADSQASRVSRRPTTLQGSTSEYGRAITKELEERQAAFKRDTASAVRFVSIWKSSGIKCGTEAAVTQVIANERERIKNSPLWLNHLISHRSALEHIVHGSKDQPMEALDEALSPLLEADARQGSFEEPLEDDFQIIGIQNSHSSCTNITRGSGKFGAVPLDSQARAAHLIDFIKVRLSEFNTVA